MIKLRTKSQILKIKSKAPLGQPPKREPGHGYDSEADDIEEDPAIEHQFVIRMMPGEDCEYLRKAISDRLIGVKQHSKDVSLHFFDREGRRAAVTIRGNIYAATLVDLPCIVETHKSWDKKNFFKVADVHQMLLVHKKIKNQDEARNAELPDTVDKTNWQFPHGLTPPLYNVRQRRFRKRVSNRTIEAVEEEVDRLLRLDAEAIETSAEVVNPNTREEDDEEDAEGEEDDGIVQNSIEDEQDAEGSDDEEDDFKRIFAQVLAGEHNNDNDNDPASMTQVEGSSAILTGTDIQASPDAMQATTETPEAQQLATPATPAGGPSATEEESADEEDDSDDDDDNDESELDEEEKARLEEEAQLKEEVDDIKKELAIVETQLKGLSNKMLRRKLEEKKNKLKRDLQLKMVNLGRNVEDDEDDE